jgi:hypothetical protein
MEWPLRYLAGNGCTSTVMCDSALNRRSSA